MRGMIIIILQLIMQNGQETIYAIRIYLTHHKEKDKLQNIENT